MTNATLQKSKNYAHTRHRRLGFCYMSIFLMILFFKNADAAALWVSRGLELCAAKLIPSLFPFMVISSILIDSGIGNVASHIFGKPFRFLFGIEGEGAISVIIGWACGFPLGAKCACELYSSQKISREEYSRLLCICGTPSPAFLISTVGKTMLGSTDAGICLYVISLLSATIVGVTLHVLRPLEQTSERNSISARIERKRLASVLTRAVSDSASSMLCVCAFVVFFSAFLGTLESALSFLHLSDTAHTLLFCFFELTSGLSEITSGASALTLPLCAAAVGWSGTSVHFQTVAICSPSASFKPYLLSCAARALISFLLCLAALPLLP